MHISGTWYILWSYAIRVGLVRTVTRQKQLDPSARTYLCIPRCAIVSESHAKLSPSPCARPPRPSHRPGITMCALPYLSTPAHFRSSQIRRHAVGPPPLSLCPSHMLSILWESLLLGPSKAFFCLYLLSTCPASGLFSSWCEAPCLRRPIYLEPQTPGF